MWRATAMRVWNGDQLSRSSRAGIVLRIRLGASVGPHAARGRIKRANIDGIGGPAAQRHRAERNRAAGYFEEFAPARPSGRNAACTALLMVCDGIEDGSLAIVCHCRFSLARSAQIALRRHRFID